MTKPKPPIFLFLIWVVFILGACLRLELAPAPSVVDGFPSPSPGNIPIPTGTAFQPALPVTPSPQAVSDPTLTLPPTVASTPIPVLRPVTSGGCCVQPFFSPDSSRVLYIDRPSPDSPSGIWGVGLEGGAPEFVTDRVGIFSGDMQLVARLMGGETTVERLADGQRWTIPSGGRAISFSPDGSQVAWTAGEPGPPFDTAQREIWISQVDGRGSRLALSLYGGGLAGWFPDGRLLVSGRLSPEEDQQSYSIWSPGDGSLREIVRGARLRGGVLSPQGAWLAYMVTFDAEPAENGLWLANTQTGERRRLDLFGAYRWREEGRLLVVPQDFAADSHRLWEVDAATGQSYPLTDPALTPFKIGNGDWAVSPDGLRIAFISAWDQNIWLLELSGD